MCATDKINGINLLLHAIISSVARAERHMRACSFQWDFVISVELTVDLFLSVSFEPLMRDNVRLRSTVGATRLKR